MNGLTLIHDPSCTREKDIKTKVLQHEAGLGFVYGGHIYYKQGNNVISYKVSTDTMARCFNRNDDDVIETTIHGLIASFRCSLGDIVDYQLEVVSTNQKIVIPHDNTSRIYMFSVSNRKNNNDYFDLCLYDGNNKTLCYNKKSLAAFTHSGDTHSSDKGFLHMIIAAATHHPQPFYLSVIGYNMKRLHMFTSQTPSVCIVNHHTRTVYILPCPLDVMSMGEEGVFAILAKGVAAGREIEFTILPRPIARANVNTGTSNSVTESALQEAASVNVVNVTTQDLTPSYPEDDFVMDFNEVPRGLERDLTCGPVVVVQDMYVVPPALTHMQSYYFGTSISPKDERAEVVLPIAGGGVVMGDNVLVHAKTPKVQNYTAILKSSKCVVVVVGEEMQNSLIDKCQSKVNAVFIVVPGTQVGDVVNIMDSVCVNAVTAMAGPCAVVLAQIRGSYYFYRGVDWPGFVEGASYGDDVSESIPQLQFVDVSAYPWPFYADMNEVYFRNNKMSVAAIETLSLEETDIPAFKNVLFQLQVIMSPERLKTIQTSILKIVANKERVLRQSAPVKRMIGEGRFKDINKYIKKHKAVYADIASMLQNIISLQKSSSKKHDLNRLMRKEVITANVEEAATQTVGDMIDELCTELGTISCLIDNGLFQSLLIHLKDAGTVSEWLKIQDTKYLTNVTNICARMTVLDGTTTSALLDNDIADTSYTCPSLSIRNIYEDMNAYDSIMFLPLHDKTYEDPHAVVWPDEANDKKVALLRIKMRSIVAEAIDQGFSPASKEVNYIIIYLYFCILEKLTHGIVPTAAEDSAVRNISRAIISSILCAASSGQSPLPLYQIVSRSASINIPSSSVWWMYFKLRALWKYTGWREDIIDKKFKHFIVKCVRKHVVDPVTTKLRQTNRQRELIKINRRYIKRNDELKWLKNTIPLIQRGDLPVPYEGDITTRGGVLIDKYLKQEPGMPRRDYMMLVCAAIVKKRSKNDWKTHVSIVPEEEEEVIDKRLNLKNLPEIDQFMFANTTIFRNVVKTLYDNHMNMERSEELAVELL